MTSRRARPRPLGRMVPTVVAFSCAHALVSGALALLGTRVLPAPWSALLALPGSGRPLFADGGALLLELGAPAVRAAPALAAPAAALLGAGFLLGRLVDGAMLASLGPGYRVTAAIRLGVRRLLRAMLVSAVVLAAVGLAASPFVWGAAHLDAWAVTRVGDVAHDLLVASVALPAVVAGTVGLAWHDLAQAALHTRPRGVRDAVRLGLHALRARVVLRRIAVALVRALLVVATLLATLTPAPETPCATLLLLVLVESGVLARALVRARWLASAHRSVQESERPVVLGAERVAPARQP